LQKSTGEHFEHYKYYKTPSNSMPRLWHIDGSIDDDGGGDGNDIAKKYIDNCI
jgi:hypothetical protein